MIRFAETECRFQPGQIVRHRRYGYRGVIVSADPRCQAEADWYTNNRTQPDQNQPWYHVLVDGTPTATYAAQSNLEADPSGEPVDHPLLREFFDGLADGQYQRNDRPWQGWR